jgi:hypothetical protein
MLFTLLKLRYKLIWAQVRTSSGKLGLLLLVYILLMAGAAVSAFGGFGAALAGVSTGQSEEIARGMLTGLLLSGVTASLFFGIGPRSAFSDRVLRRYPLSSFDRMWIRYLLGIIDPIWAIVAASVFGLAVGLALLGQGSWIWGLGGALIFLSVSYLFALFLLSLLDRILETRSGAATLGIIGLAVISFSGLGIGWLVETKGSRILEWVNEITTFLPSGLAARTMTSSHVWQAVSSMSGLLIWAVSLAALVRIVESIPVFTRSAAREAINWENFYDRVALWIGGRYAPLVSKSLRYHLRSQRVRFGLASAPLVALVGKFMARGDVKASEFLFTLAFFLVLGSGTSSVSLNHFGADEKGIVRYGLIPVSFAAPVRAGSTVSMLLGFLLIAPSILVWVLVTDVPVDWRMIAMLWGSGITGLFIFEGMGMMTTILTPRRVDFSSILGNPLSTGTNIAVMLLFFGIFGLAFALMKIELDVVLAFWWLSTVCAVAALMFYLIAWRVSGSLAALRRESLIKEIAG